MDGNNVLDGMKVETSETHPREINVLEFVKGRVAQIADLLEVVDNTTLVSGEVTKGPRTAVQRLPRHMRRRAMSYNVKRLPRLQRRFALSVTKLSKHRKKPYSRFWRRRPRNLLKDYVRRQKQHVWLETHIWHAKRFEMVKKYGYKLAMRSFQRGFRPSYRDSIRNCVVHDVSFYRCIQIIVEDRQMLIDCLRPFFPSAVTASIACRIALEGKFEIPALLYRPDDYPLGFIGPVRFMWCRQDENCWSLLMWLHPSTYRTVMEFLIQLFELSKNDNNVMDKNGAFKSNNGDSAFHSVYDWHLWNGFSKYNDFYVSKSKNCAMLDLRNQLVRFRLYGPQSLKVLQEVLQVVDDNDLDTEWSKKYKTSNMFWKRDASGRMFSEFPDGLVISLLVADPRKSRPARKRKPLEGHIHTQSPISVEDIVSPPPDFWDFKIRKAVLELRIMEKDMQRQKKNTLLIDKPGSLKIPIMLIVRNANSGTTNTFNGVDLIVPTGFGMDFWLALQYGLARAIGLRDQKSIEFESGRFIYPNDAPDCAAGVNELNEEYKYLRERHLVRPRNRRIKYWSSLSMKYPFQFKWAELVGNWVSFEKAESANCENIYVLRDRKYLSAIDRWVQGNGPEPTAIIKMHALSLVPVRLNAQRSGRSLRFAIICVPDEKDLLIMSDKWNRGKRKVEESRCFVNDGEFPENSIANDFEGFVELAGAKMKDFISLDQCFPDKGILRKRKLIATRKQKRLKRKVPRHQNLEGDTLTKSSKKKMMEEVSSVQRVKMSDVSYRESCSRMIIGRIVRGDYSFCSGRGRGIGYCSLLGLRAIHNAAVLFRNTSSKDYHFGKISVISELMDL